MDICKNEESNMRVWSLHPKYLDARGMVALWRETLLAKHVLEGKTKGYKQHPQLNRFKGMESPLDAINAYLAEVYHESVRRGYRFDKTKVDWAFSGITMPVNSGQLEYEFHHLLKKLEIRDAVKWKQVLKIKKIESHPLFVVVDGIVEEWEIR